MHDTRAALLFHFIRLVLDFGNGFFFFLFSSPLLFFLFLLSYSFHTKGSVFVVIGLVVLKITCIGEIFFYSFLFLFVQNLKFDCIVGIL